jgi:hypothetical protein
MAASPSEMREESFADEAKGGVGERAPWAGEGESVGVKPPRKRSGALDDRSAPANAGVRCKKHSEREIGVGEDADDGIRRRVDGEEEEGCARRGSRLG